MVVRARAGGFLGDQLLGNELARIVTQGDTDAIDAYAAQRADLATAADELEALQAEQEDAVAQLESRNRELQAEVEPGMIPAGVGADDLLFYGAGLFVILEVALLPLLFGVVSAVGKRDREETARERARALSAIRDGRKALQYIARETYPLRDEGRDPSK